MIFFCGIVSFLKIRYFKICKKIKVSHLKDREQVNFNVNNIYRSIY